MIIALIAISVLVVAFAGITWYLHVKNNALKLDFDMFAQANAQLKIQNQELADRIHNLAIEKETIRQSSQTTISQLIEQLQDTERKLSAATTTATVITEKEKQLTQLEESIKFAEAQYKTIQAQLSAITQDLETKNTELGTAWANVEEQQKQYNKLVTELSAITKQLEISATEYAEIQASIEELKERKIAATERFSGEDNGRKMECNASELRLYNTLEELKIGYPALASAFSDIIWKNIWQPKFQAMTKDIQKPTVCGIYRIFTKENGMVRSYVGQAKDIRDRWSQHIKGMINGGTGKLYAEVRPENAYFEIIETCALKDLNEREHYWIEYYCSVETGYNLRN